MMDLKKAFLHRYKPIYRYYLDFFYKELAEVDFSTRPNQAVNPVLWVLWHVARSEDIGLNRLVVDGTQVADEGDWLKRLNLPYRHFGIGMTDGEVDDLCLTIKPSILFDYHQAVGQRTQEIVADLTETYLDEVVLFTQLERVMKDEESAKPDIADRVIQGYKGRTRGWYLMHLGLTHTYQHIGEAMTVASMLGYKKI